MENIFRAVTCFAIVAAAICLLNQMNDAAFVVAVLGCVAWFLSHRFKIKKQNES